MLRMTRAELHALVWSKPLTEIAKLFGVGDQHLARACDEYEIARPRAGHWQRVGYAKAVEKVALDNKNFSSEETLVIGRQPDDPASGAANTKMTP